MAPADPARVRSLFEAALQQPAEARQAFLVREADGDDPLRLRVEALLSAHELGAAGALEPPDDPRARLLLEEVSTALGTGAKPPAEPSSLELARGVSFGEYRLLREIGRGGMGVVWAARQAYVNRRVALKILALSLIHI